MLPRGRHADRVSRIDLQVDAAAASHNASGGQYESQTGHGMMSQPQLSILLLRRSSLSILHRIWTTRKNLRVRYPRKLRWMTENRIDLPHPGDVVPSEYQWRQCAVFIEIEKMPRIVRSAMTLPTRGDISYGNTFLSETDEENVYGVL